MLGRHDVVWAAHRDFALDRHASVPLALFPETCCYRQRGLQALATADRSFHVVYTADRHQDRGEPRRGRDDDRPLHVAGNWRVLDEADGFPSLPAADLELHRSPGICDPLTDDRCR